MSQVFNPYLPSFEYVPDGEPRIFNNRLYIYGSHDRFNGDDFCLNDYVCYSAPLDDLSDFKYHGVIFKKSQDPNLEINNPMNSLNAPDCIQGKDGKYYFYYQAMRNLFIVVARSDKPEGPFEYIGIVKLKDGTIYGGGNNTPFSFDPSIFIDDDGKIYLYVGFSPLDEWAKAMDQSGILWHGAYVCELEDDMVSVKDNTMRLIVPGEQFSKGTGYEGHGFYEASSMRKHKGKYYFTYSSSRSNELCYAISDYPNRDFKYGGTLIAITDEGYKGNKEKLNSHGNTHGGMVMINEQLYIFYHRQTNKQRCARQGCAEPIFIKDDYSIEQTEMTSAGLNNGPLDGRGIYEARIACNLSSKIGPIDCLEPHEKDDDGIYPYFTQEGNDREDNPNQYIANIKDGSWCAFKYFKIQQLTKIAVLVRGSASGTLKVSLNRDKGVIANIKIESAQDYKWFASNVSVKDSIKEALYFTYVGDGYLDFKAFELR